MRADHWLRKEYPGLTRRHVEEALVQRLVTGAGGGALACGDDIDPYAPPDCTRLEAHLAMLRAGNRELSVSVIAELPDLAVVDKPPGMPSHPLSLMETGTITHWALARYTGIGDWAGQYQPTITPHRLDTGTSGVLLVARTASAYGQWRRRFGSGSVEKTYLAWCHGTGPARPLTCTLPIAHDPTDRRRMMCVPEQRHRRIGRIFAAETRVRTIEQRETHFLCEVSMRTGFMHQIRVHMAALGHPLLGDSLYGNANVSIDAGIGHALLRCVTLRSGEAQFHAQDAAFRRDPLR